MKTPRRVVIGLAVVAFVLGLAGCPSPFLAAIKAEIAKAPFVTKSYTFLRQWGNTHPEYAFYSPIVRSDIAGNVFVADFTFRVRKFDQNGVLQTYFNVAMPSFIFSDLFDMAIDPSGNIFVGTGSCFFGCSGLAVQEYDSSGNAVGAPWGSFGSGTMSLTTDASGHVYVVDSSNNNVKKYTSSGQLLATFTASPTALSSPAGIAFDGTYLYVTDTGNNRVVVFDTSGNIVTTWGGSTLYNGVALSAPSGIAVAYVGNSKFLYVIDKNRSRIVLFDTSGTYETTWGSAGTGNGQFTTPTSVAVDAATYIYVTDSGANVNQTNRVQKFTPGAFPPSPVTAPTYNTSWLEASSAGGNGVFSYPGAVAFDSAGNVYVSDMMNNRIEKFDSSGIFKLQWGTWGVSPTPFNFSGGGCYGMAVDSAGRLYVSDGGNAQVEEFDTSGNFIKVIGNGVIGNPRGVAVDSSGNVYVADSTNNQVEVFSPNSVLLRSWGSKGAGNGQFQSPYGLAIDSGGNVWVTDSTNNNVQKFDSKGNFLLALGGANYGSSPGQFLYPVAVAVDQVAGGVYVADFGNRRIQKFDPSGNFVAELGTSGTPDGFSWPFGCAINSSGQVIVSDYQDGLVIEYAPVVR